MNWKDEIRFWDDQLRKQRFRRYTDRFGNECQERVCMLIPPISKDYHQQRPYPQEPAITINGSTLTTAQAMAVRVAIESFAAALAAEGLGDDEGGRAMTAAYLDRIAEIRVPLYAPLLQEDNP